MRRRHVADGRMLVDAVGVHANVFPLLTTGRGKRSTKYVLVIPQTAYDRVLPWLLKTVRQEDGKASPYVKQVHDWWFGVGGAFPENFGYLRRNLPNQTNVL